MSSLYAGNARLVPRTYLEVTGTGLLDSLPSRQCSSCLPNHILEFSVCAQTFFIQFSSQFVKKDIRDFVSPLGEFDSLAVSTTPHLVLVFMSFSAFPHSNLSQGRLH